MRGHGGQIQRMIAEFRRRAKPGRRMMVVSPNAESINRCRRAFLEIPGTYEVDNYVILNGATIGFQVPMAPEPESQSIILDDPHVPMDRLTPEEEAEIDRRIDEMMRRFWRNTERANRLFKNPPGDNP